MLNYIKKFTNIFEVTMQVLKRGIRMTLLHKLPICIYNMYKKHALVLSPDVFYHDLLYVCFPKLIKKNIITWIRSLHNVLMFRVI